MKKLKIGTDIILTNNAYYRKEEDAAYTNPKNYITILINDIKTLDDNTKEILKIFPEFNDGQYNTTITDNGLIIFFNNNNKIAYDMFQEDTDTENKSVSFDDIIPDNSLNLKYNLKNNPLNVRRLNIEWDENDELAFSVIPDRTYKSNNKYYYQINCDIIDINNAKKLDENNFFESDKKLENIDTVGFIYKPVYIIRNLENKDEYNTVYLREDICLKGSENNSICYFLLQAEDLIKNGKKFSHVEVL